jgi:hypothetical protein
MTSDMFLEKLLTFVEQAKTASAKHWDISSSDFDDLFKALDVLDEYIGSKYAESPSFADDE